MTTLYALIAAKAAAVTTIAAVTADRDIRCSDDSNKYEGVRQLGITKRQ